MQKKPLQPPTITNEEMKKLLPPASNFLGLSDLFGHLAPNYLKHLVTNSENYAWFRYVESESKSHILKKFATRAMYKLLDKKDHDHFLGGNENGYLIGKKALGLTSRGVNYKSTNEDGIGIFEQKDILRLVCCDGVGDCLAGEVATYIILNEFSRNPRLDIARIYELCVNRISQLAMEMRKEIPEFNTFPNEISQAAVTALQIKGNKCEISQVGDVLVFHLRKGKLEMLNQDGEWLSLRELSRLFSDERYLSFRHIIKNAVGQNYDNQWQPQSLTLEKGDQIVLASDGLETLHPKDVHEILLKDSSPQEALDQLYEKAIGANLKWNTVGSPNYTKPDNISIVLYRHGG